MNRYVTFVRLEGVEPTNILLSERSSRRTVAQGQFWHAECSGSRFVATIMTVVATLKQQHRPPLDYLTAAREAALRGEAALSLLPTDSLARQGAA